MARTSTVYDLDGRRIGQTERAAELFLAALAEALDDGPCYVLTHPDVPEEFLESLRRFCPVVVDADLAAGATYLIEGAP